MSYRGMENSRNPLMRPKNRAMFSKHNCDQMASANRARYMPGIPIPSPRAPFQATVSFGQPYPTINSPDFQPVQYATPVSAPPVWNQPIPLTMNETYQIPNQHSYATQQQIYNTEAAHLMTIKNTPFISQVINQTEFDPLTNVCRCPKCTFVNNLALIQLKQLLEENQRLREQLNAKERQQITSYEDSVRSSPALQASVSSLSADAQPFHMGTTQGQTTQGLVVNAEPTADGASRLHNPNGNDYHHRPAHNWPSHRDTPVVSASGSTEDRHSESATSDQFNESATSDPDCNNTIEHDDTDNTKYNSSAQQELVDSPVSESTSVDVNEEWERSEREQQESSIVHTVAGAFVTSTKQDNDIHTDKSGKSSSHNDGYGSQRADRNSLETPKGRPKDQRMRLNKNKGVKNEDSYRETDSRRDTDNRRSSYRHNSSYMRSSSPQTSKERRMGKSIGNSRESSQSRIHSGSDYNNDKRELSSGDVGVKVYDNMERSYANDRRLESSNRFYSYNRGDSMEKGHQGRRSSSNSRRYSDFEVRKGKASEDSNWRQGDQENSASKGGNSGSRRSQLGSWKGITEKEGDLFSAPEDFSLAHCVAADLRMGSGIAVRFRQQFKNVEELFDQKKGVGEVAVLEDKSRFIFYLITKARSTGKPTWASFVQTIEELKKECLEREVKNLAMPRIGCGLDRLEWRNVKKLLVDTFSETSVSITVYNFQQIEELEGQSAKSKSSLYIKHVQKDLVDIEQETGLLFLCADEFTNIDRTLESLDKKHKILHDLRVAKHHVGDLVTIQKGREYLYGLVVKKFEKDPFSYVNFGKCLKKLRNCNSKEHYGYFAMEAFRDNNDPLTMEKIITNIRNIFGCIQYPLEFYVCWPKELESDHDWEDLTNTPNANIPTTPMSK